MSSFGKTRSSNDQNKVLYVLRLQDDCWYVGTTNDLQRRVSDHSRGQGAAWTKAHPVIKLYESMPCPDPLLEDYKTKEYMRRYGMDKVRGGTYCQIRLNEQQVEALTQEFRMADGQCLNCGGDHYIHACPEPKSKGKGRAHNGQRVAKTASPAKKSDPSDRALCIRCGRNNHTVDTCYANTRRDGTPLRKETPVFKEEPKTKISKAEVKKESSCIII